MVLRIRATTASWKRRKKHGPSIAEYNNIDEHQSERLFWRSIQLHFRQGISRPALRLMMLWTAPPPARECQGCGRRLRLPRFGGAPMQSISTIGLDIAKSVFQVHGVDATGQVVLRRQLRPRHVLAFFQKLPPCLVGIAACASSHHWSRELQALGHTVRLMPPAYVKPYVKRQKNDSTDAEAICEAVTRPNMRFVPTKTPEQQSCLKRASG